MAPVFRKKSRSLNMGSERPANSRCRIALSSFGGCCDLASVMIQKFVTILRRVHHELLDLNHTSRINELVSLEIPKFANELGGWHGCELRNRDTSVPSPNCLYISTYTPKAIRRLRGTLEAFDFASVASCLAIAKAVAANIMAIARRHTSVRFGARRPLLSGRRHSR
jgi:hypothetical protein